QGTKAANPFADRDMYFQGVRGKIEQSSRLRCPILGWPVPSSDSDLIACGGLILCCSGEFIRDLTDQMAA
ncbi:MAG: hypothetical protein ACLQVM_27560, partial [Terriglobia bacterium]